jgi:glycosyltransferase involved in cell wall biosynthesis
MVSLTFYLCSLKKAMKKILFIAAHRSKRSPSQRYRFEQYFEFLNQNGFVCKLSNLLDENDDRIFYGNGNVLQKFFITLKGSFKRLFDVLDARKYDIILVQREAFMTYTTFFERQFSKSKAKLVYDFDDSLWLLDTSEANQKWEWMKSPNKTSRIISLSDLVFAGNNYLANYAKQFNTNVVVIPTTIDTALFKRQSNYQENEKVTIGWSGSHTTIKHFESAIPFLRRLKEKYQNNICFKLMGDPAYSNAELDIIGIPWSNENEVAILESFDIGIMPLPQDEWVKGKCGLKGLSYMSLEVPTIMSAVGVNPEIIRDGVNGFLANDENEWFEKLSLLIDDFELRKKIGKAGRLTVLERYSVDSQKYNYLQQFNNLTQQ